MIILYIIIDKILLRPLCVYIDFDTFAAIFAQEERSKQCKKLHNFKMLYLPTAIVYFYTVKIGIYTILSHYE